MPIDQHLFYRDTELGPPEATLGQLRVPPNAVIELKADQPTDEVTILR